MATLEETWARVGFEDPAAVERLLVRGTLAGAISGGLGALVATATLGQHVGPLAVAFAAGLLLVVVPRQTFGLRLPLTGAALLLPFLLPWSPSTLAYFFTVPLGIALALEPLPWLRRVVALAGPSLGGAWCLQSVQWLSARHLGAVSVLSWVAALGAGLFLSVGAVLAWVTFAADEVEPKLAGQPKVLQAWVRLRTALGRIPNSGARAGLEALVRNGALRCVSARAARDELAGTLDAAAEAGARDAVKALQQRLTETADPELAAHFRHLLRVHQDTLEQFDGLHRQLERLDARAAAEAGWLERAAFAIELAPKGETRLRELASRLEALSAGINR